ncbi:MAG: hypothetical protein J6L87_06775 [Clostridia bacterium]|nr:hypothetical protein [Clostridia bacterium]
MQKHCEGELYRVIALEGQEFAVYYGYYEECDRQNPMVKPVPLYPDFIARPQYDNDGYPFATEMQDACRLYEGKDPEDGCCTCKHYCRVLDFIGLCTCEKRRKKDEAKQ